jgi:hypothetical protein
VISDAKKAELDAIAAERAGQISGQVIRPVLERHFEHEILRRLDKIERLLELPHGTAFQTGVFMAIGSIAPGTTGQFSGVVQFPSGVTAPAGYNPSLTWSSSDSSITFAPATTDATNGAIPLANQVVASVPSGDTNTTASVSFTFAAPDGTTITSNAVSFSIPQAPPPPPAEPTGIATQVA